MKSDRAFEPLSVTAARWVDRRNAGLTPSEQRDLQNWLAADERHAEAFAKADLHPSELDWPMHSGTAERVLTGLQARAERRRSRRMRVGATLALVALVLVGGATARFYTRTNIEPASFVVQSPLRETLPDGSRVELPPGVELATFFTATERRVSLSGGHAHFEVAKDADRPFVVDTGAVVARAVGTAFVVAMDQDKVTVIVTEGTVAIDRASTPDGGNTLADTLALVQAGASVAVTRTNDNSTAPVVTPVQVSSSDERVAWRIPRLEFKNTRLGDVIEIVNRYNSTRFVFADESLKRFRISGALRADRLDALIEMLEHDLKIATHPEGNQIILDRNSS